MKNLTVIIIAILFILTGCVKHESDIGTPIVSKTEYNSTTKNKETIIRKQLENVTLGLMTLANDEQFISMVNKLASASNKTQLRTIDLQASYRDAGLNLLEIVYDNIIITTDDFKEAEAVVNAFFHFNAAGTTYYPAITLMGNFKPQEKPAYIVNQESSESTLFYGYLDNGQPTYMQITDLSTLNGWIVYETVRPTKNQGC